MASHCRPPYPSEPNDTPLAALVDEVFRAPLRVLSDARLCKWLGITPDLARERALQTILPPELRAERTPPLGGLQGLEKQKRLDFITTYAAEHGCPSAEKMAQVLEVAGIKASRLTVNDDLNVLGFATEPSRRAGRPPKAQRLAIDEAQQVLVLPSVCDEAARDGVKLEAEATSTWRTVP